MKLALVLLLAASPAAAQWVDPDWDFTAKDTYEHVAAGAIVDVLVRGPWTAASWRGTVRNRVALVGLVAVVYELGQVWDAVQNDRRGPGYGFSGKDVLATVSGALIFEGAVALIRKVTR